MRRSDSARPRSRYIFVTGGVVSSLGKGVACAAIGALLEDHGLRVAIMKFDPYINVDAGTMNPFQHGEVFVTDDGAETDLDLGHYERYMEDNASRYHNVTTGQIYQSVIEKERRGEYLGKTVQVVPHITDEIKARVHKLAAVGNYHVVIVEVGGTVGDIESLPFLEAIRQLQAEMPRGSAISMHLTLVPYIKAAGELKTKPTQHSVKEMREIGIQPDVLLCRTEKPFDEETRRKIAQFCNVEPQAVIMAPDVDEVYTIPLSYKDQGLDSLLIERLGLSEEVAKAEADPNSPGHGGMEPWYALEKQVVAARQGPAIHIGFVGKYVNLQDAYKSVYEALRHAGFANGVKVIVHRIEAEEVEDPEALSSELRRMHGVLIPGGFGSRGIEGKVATANLARKENIPYFGICLGMQVAVIEFAREVCGLKGAHSTEMNPDTPHPVIDLMTEQKNVQAMGGTMRLGAYDCLLKAGSLAADAYGRHEERVLRRQPKNPAVASAVTQPDPHERLVISERHRHRYEVNNKYLPIMTERGLVVSGLNEASGLVELVELPKSVHPWYLGCQFHPEFRSRPLAPHPLFTEFIAAATVRARHLGETAISSDSTRAEVLS